MRKFNANSFRFTTIVMLASLLFLIANINSTSAILPYSYNGTIYEDGDQDWDNNELNFHRVIVPPDTFFEIELECDPSAELYLAYGYVSDYNELQEAIDDEDYDTLLVIDYTISGFVRLTLDTTQSIDANVVIFSYNLNNPYAMDYTLYSSIARSSGTPTYNESSGFNFTFIFWIILIGVVIFFVVRSQNKSKTRYQTPTYGSPDYTQPSQYQPQRPYDQRSYNQPSYNQPSYSPPTEPEKPSTTEGDQLFDSSPATKYCSNCGFGNTKSDRFCTECGTML